RLRPYALQPFCIEADVLTVDELRDLGLGDAPRTLFGRALRRLRKPAMAVISERSFGFDPAVLDCRTPCYLKGYWQSPKYFAAIEPKIRRELTVSTPLKGQNEELAERIRASIACSIHVRRGDYVTSSPTNKYHGSCSGEYYYAAERFLQRHVNQLRLFVFSDDPEWARRNLRFASPAVVVDHNHDQGHEDLRLMTMCRHHVIANSTFSWWGAWLCDHPEKIVIAPQKWFGEAGHSTEDLIPKNWARV
ncbi:MAG TPA: alpha-1,2-fucosyltransferase, partial [Nitrospiraceae bacterium]